VSVVILDSDRDQYEIYICSDLVKILAGAARIRRSTAPRHGFDGRHWWRRRRGFLRTRCWLVGTRRRLVGTGWRVRLRRFLRWSRLGINRRRCRRELLRRSGGRWGIRNTLLLLLLVLCPRQCSSQAEHQNKTAPSLLANNESQDRSPIMCGLLPKLGCSKLPIWCI